MKVKNIYKLFGLMVLFVALQSRSNGPGNVANLQVTGAPGSTGASGTCANTGCHTSGSFDPSVSIKLMEGADEVTDYMPGQTYKLNITFSAGNGTPARYGFQAVSLSSSDNQAGIWGDLGSGKHTVTLSGRVYAEHSAPSTSETFEMEWIAPAVNTGPVTFYAAGIAANNNGGNTGDGMANNSVTIEELPYLSTFISDQTISSFKVLPNPVGEMLNLEINSQKTGEFQVRVIDSKGALVRINPVDIRAGLQTVSMDVQQLNTGMYIVQLCGEGHLAAVQMLKK